MRNDFSQQFNGVLEMAQAEADRFNSPMIVSEHFLLGSLRDRNSTVFKIMSQLNIDTNKMEADIERHLTNQVPSGEATTLFEKQYKIALSAIRHLQLATSEARKMNSHSIQGEHLLLALIHDSRAMDSDFLRKIKEEYLNFDISIQMLNQEPRGNKDFASEEDDEDDDSVLSGSSTQHRQSAAASGKSGKNSGSDTPALDKFGFDMTKAASEGRLDPVVGLSLIHI